MGMSLFGSRDLSCSQGTYSSSTPKETVEPIPSKFIINDIQQEGIYVVAEIQYPNCTNYEGIKIIVFKGATVAEIQSLRLIDPHFLETNRVFARFEPTIEGKLAAIGLCVTLSQYSIKTKHNYK